MEDPNISTIIVGVLVSFLGGEVIRRREKSQVAMLDINPAPSAGMLQFALVARFVVLALLAFSLDQLFTYAPHTLCVTVTLTAAASVLSRDAFADESRRTMLMN